MESSWVVLQSGWSGAGVVVSPRHCLLGLGIESFLEALLACKWRSNKALLESQKSLHTLYMERTASCGNNEAPKNTPHLMK